MVDKDIFLKDFKHTFIRRETIENIKKNYPTILIDDEDTIYKCVNYAINLGEIKEDYYKNREQKDTLKITWDFMTGIFGETAFSKFIDSGKLSKVDYNIYPVEKNSYKSDLIYDSKYNIHVKSQNAHSFKNYGMGWTLQSKRGDCDPLINKPSCEDYLTFCFVHLDTDYFREDSNYIVSKNGNLLFKWQDIDYYLNKLHKGVEVSCLGLFPSKYIKDCGSQPDLEQHENKKLILRMKDCYDYVENFERLGK
jgi:hypothetical protein